jgi:hypothetical protein
LAQPFIQYTPNAANYWHAIILFGRNVATYKFALARALLELRPEAGRLIKLEDLAVPYTRLLREHLRLADKQGTFQKSQFLDACRRANAGELGEQQLLGPAIKLGFSNVIDAFHFVGHAEIPERFFVDERIQNAGIRVTDAFSRLLGTDQSPNLPDEAEARWRLVETAWELGLSRSLVVVSHDPIEELFYVIDAARRRTNVTVARDALRGYQKGHCFYCFDSLSNLSRATHVDHFFPHRLKEAGFTAIDGVWNLVLACARCNGGPGGKFDRVPSIKLLERLSTRNEFLIGSHHPLRETLMGQTGKSELDRRSFLNDFHRRAREALVHEWQTVENAQPVF